MFVYQDMKIKNDLFFYLLIKVSGDNMAIVNNIQQDMMPDMIIEAK